MALDAPYIHFLGYRLDPAARTLTAPDGSDVALSGRAFDVLTYLIEQRPRVVGKDELLAAVWPGRVVEENNLGQAISSLRRVLGTGAGDRRFIRTVTGRGYSFVAEVAESPVAPPARVPPEDAPAFSPAALSAPGRRRLGLQATATALLLVLLVAWGWREQTAAPRPDIASATLAVLPFSPLDPAPSDEMMGLGIAETVITRLSHATRLRVLSLGSAQAMTGKTIDPLRAGATLGADFVVDGHLQHIHGSVRVTARLLAMPGGHALWAGTFDQPEQKVFEVQDAIASRVAATLSQVYSAGEGASGCYGADPVAYRAYLRGYYLINRPGPLTVDEADAAFHEALARDPACARAWAGISQAHRLRVMVSNGDPEVEFPQAEAAVAKALAIDPDSAEAYNERGALQFWYRWDWPAAETSLRHAIALDPNLVNAHLALAHLYNNIGRHDSALVEARIAVALDPLSPIVNTLAAWFVDSAGQRREAEARLDNALELEPDFWVALFNRGMRELSRGDRLGAERDMRHAVEETGRSTRSLVYLASFYVSSKRTDEARGILAEMEARRAHGEYVLPSTRALVHLALGEKKQALDLLEQGYQHGDPGLAFLDVWFAGLAGEPRYAALLQVMHLPPPPPDDAGPKPPRK